MNEDDEFIDSTPFEEKSEDNLEDDEEIDRDIEDSDDDDDDEFQTTLVKENLKRVPDNERISMNRLTKYERVSLISTRATQLDGGIPSVLADTSAYSNNLQVAEEELKQKIIPLKVKRTMPDGRYELWKISELVEN